MTKRENPLLKLSPSAIKTYEQCARKYYFSYIARLPKKSWEHLTLGSFVHAVLEHFHNELMAKPDLDWADLMTRCFAEQVAAQKPDGSLIYPLKRESKIKAHEMLTTYLAVMKKDGLPKVLANERSFSIKLDEDLVIRGVVDRIDQDADGLYRLCDYKTGKSRYLDEFQLLVYGLLLLQDEPKLESFKGDYIALAEGSKRIQYRFTRTDLDRVLTKIRKVADLIRTDQTWEPKPGFLCNYCDFEDVCPAMKSGFKKIGKGDAWTQTSKGSD